MTRKSKQAAAVESLESRRLFYSFTLWNAGFDIHETLQLMNGQLLSQSFGSTTWNLLTPSSTGSYLSPSVTPAASSTYAHEYYGSAVMKDGRVFVSGSEYGSGNNELEIYDPLRNSWTTIAKPSFFPANMSDNSVKVLPDGDVLDLSGYQGQVGLYHPATNTWTQAADFPTGWTNEVSDAMLPDGSVFALGTAYSPYAAYRYVPSSNQWIFSGNEPTALQTGEGGPIAQLPDGKLFVLGYGGSGAMHTAIYTPPGNNTGTGTWTIGPDLPGTPDALSADTPMATLPNGDILMVMHDNATSRDRWFEYVESSNSLTELTNLPAAISTDQSRSDIFRLMTLPTGQVFITGVGGNQSFIFTPDGAPKAAWQPVVTKVTANADGSYQLTGTGITGVSEGGVYGDDNSMSTNYPLVQLTNSSGVVTYARSYNASTTAIDTGSLAETTGFVLPAGLTNGTYQLRVIASGISSSPFSFTIGGAGQLTGTPIGTAGSYKNDGNTLAKVFDGNLSTYFDGPSPSGDVVGLDLGTADTITRINYAPRAGFTSRMVGGIFQASNSSNFSSGVVTLATITTAPPAGLFSSVAVTTPGAYRYVRYVAPANSYGNVAELQFFGTAGGHALLTGTVIGTSGSYQGDGNTAAKAFDGSLSTFFDGPTASGDWVGLDLGSAKSISQISYAPRSGYASRMVGGIFQASNTANFSSGVVNLYTVTTTPATGSLTTVTVTATGTYRYVRYLAPSNSYGNIAEAEFFS